MLQRRASRGRPGTVALAAVAAVAGVASSAPARAQALQATLVQTGFAWPVALASPPGDLQRLFVVEQGGKIRVVKNGAILPAPFLDLGPSGLNKIVSGGEAGLLGLAFHPGYATNGFFCVNYTSNGAFSTVVERYQVSANPDVALAASGLPLITVAQPAGNHNGGCLQFGPDGKLYVGMGDGGTGSTAQALDSLLGKMLRLDVDLPPPYVPQDNPFVGPGAPLDEIWHLGLRNPWRFSFDRLTGEMYIGDVGSGSVEEVSYAKAGIGALNFGWRCMEGTVCTGFSGCTCNAPSLTPPIHEYSHASGCAIVGGHVYRGTKVCGLEGTYFHADYCSSSVWSFRYVNGQVTETKARTIELEPAGPPTIDRISAFGEDGAGELYVLDHHDGEVYRIDPADCDGDGHGDSCEISGGRARDCNANWIPDSCEIASGDESDCNLDQVPDSCEIASGAELDCNANAVPDSCEIASGSAADCNANQVPDTCDLASGTSLDTNGNAIPDECECQGGTPPFTYCTPKVNSQFCVPAVDFTGVPSLSAPVPFVIRATQVLNNKNGLLFYGFGGSSAPFQGGVLCVLPPVHRTPIQGSGGSPAGLDCSGALTFDFSAWMLAGSDPMLGVVGQQVNAQFWSRDPLDPFLSSTTDAVQFQICQ